MKKFLAYFHNTGCASAISSKLNYTRLSLYFLYTLLPGAIVCACSNDLDVRQAYAFDLVTMPVPKKVKKGETVEIRCTLVREGNYRDVKFFIRMFQTDGEGELKTDEGTVFEPNDLYPLTKSVFRLYYTSFSEEQSVFTVYIEDSFGQVIERTFSFQDDPAEDTGQATGFKEYMKAVFSLQCKMLAGGSSLL